MYLRGNKWSYTKRKKPVNPWRIIVLALAVGIMVYINQVVVPATPPLFVPTPTPTRAPESFVTDAEKLLAQGKISLAIQARSEEHTSELQSP
jgi:hypothetical protein